MDPLDPSQDFDPKARPQQSRHSVRARPPPPPPPPPAPRAPSAAWTEHIAPTGVKYYHNSATGQSMWTNPNAPPVPPPILPDAAVPYSSVMEAVNVGVVQEVRGDDAAEKTVEKEEEDSGVKKERAVAMKRLPNSDWAIILTSLDNEYFLNIETHEAVWEMPDDVAELVGQIMAGGYENEMDVPEEENDELEPQSLPEIPVDDYDQLEDEKEVVRVYGSGTGPGGVDAALAQRQQQLAIMQQFEANEAAMREKRKTMDDSDQPQTEKRAKTDSESNSKNTPELSNAEKQSMFIDMLRELDISPFSTWEKEQQQFTQDARFIQIPLPKTRKHYFEIYCKTRSVEIQKDRAQHKIKTPAEIFKSLLQEVLGGKAWSTLTSHRSQEDFMRKYRKDERFLAVNDDRDRRALYSDFVKQLKNAESDKVRAEASRKYDAFSEMLKAVPGFSINSVWRDIIPKVERDKRFLAIPTSAQREELFRDTVVKLKLEQTNDETERKEIERKEREASSLREREEAVQKQKMELSRQLKYSQSKLVSSESENLFKTLLVDLIKSHKETWKESADFVTRDPRFNSIRLQEYELAGLFAEHTENLFKKRLAAFHALVSERTYMTTPFEDVAIALMEEPQTIRLDCTKDELARLYQSYQKEREEKATLDLQTCLKENGFVRFHVKSAVGNCHVQAVDKGLKEAEEGAEWRLIGLDEIKAVLKDDKRYIDFECFAAERDRIVFSFVKQLIEEFRSEKGGVLDSIVARNAGGFVKK
ncbi:transcription elongation regulator [Chytriomyces hyalinus]|nr:transcription elongation regulator [Chytriomyces hyalinus]